MWKYASYALFLSLVILTFAVCYLMNILIPVSLEYETVTMLLQTVTNVCGVLVAFVGVMVTFQLSFIRQEEDRRSSPTDRQDLWSLQRYVLSISALTLAFFVGSTLIGLLGLASLTKPFSPTYFVKWSVFFLVSGVVSLFGLLYLQSTARTPQAVATRQLRPDKKALEQNSSTADRKSESIPKLDSLDSVYKFSFVIISLMFSYLLTFWKERGPGPLSIFVLFAVLSVIFWSLGELDFLGRKIPGFPLTKILLKMSAWMLFIYYSVNVLLVAVDQYLAMPPPSLPRATDRTCLFFLASLATLVVVYYGTLCYLWRHLSSRERLVSVIAAVSILLYQSIMFLIMLSVT